MMNSMCYVSDCGFEGAKALKLSAKTADFGRLLKFFGKKQEKCTKIWQGLYLSTE